MKKYRDYNPQLIGESAELSDKAQLSLEKKANNSGIPYEILEEVYHRGIKCWSEVFDYSPEQFAFDRVNSFIAGGFARQLDEDLAKACWKGYEAIGMKKKNGRKVPNCVPVKEATFQGKKVPLNKPMKGDVKKSKVYVDPDGDGKAQKVNFGDKQLSIKKNQPDRKASYCARSGGIKGKSDVTSANYWSRRAWNCEETEVTEDSVRDITSHLTSNGWKLARTSGGHDVYKHPNSRENIAVPRHKGDLAPGTARQIKKKAIVAEDAEKHSKDFRNPASRFVGSDELVKVYKSMTPGQIETIKRVVKEAIAMAPPPPQVSPPTISRPAPGLHQRMNMNRTGSANARLGSGAGAMRGGVQIQRAAPYSGPNARMNASQGGTMKASSTNVGARAAPPRAPSGSMPAGQGGAMNAKPTVGSGSLNKTEFMGRNMGSKMTDGLDKVSRGMSKVVPNAVSKAAGPAVSRAVGALGGAAGAAISAAAPALADKMKQSHDAGHKSFVPHDSGGEKASSVFDRMRKQDSKGSSINSFEKKVNTPNNPAPKADAPERKTVDAPLPPTRPTHMTFGSAFSDARSKAQGPGGSFEYTKGSGDTATYNTSVKGEKVPSKLTPVQPESGKKK